MPVRRALKIRKTLDTGFGTRKVGLLGGSSVSGDGDDFLTIFFEKASA